MQTKCILCGKIVKDEDKAQDHIFPKYLENNVTGVYKDWLKTFIRGRDNLAVAHIKCNRAKGCYILTNADIDNLFCSKEKKEVLHTARDIMKPLIKEVESSSWYAERAFYINEQCVKVPHNAITRIYLDRSECGGNYVEYDIDKLFSELPIDKINGCIKDIVHKFSRGKVLQEQLYVNKLGEIESLDSINRDCKAIISAFKEKDKIISLAECSDAAIGYIIKNCFGCRILLPNRKLNFNKMLSGKSNIRVIVNDKLFGSESDLKEYFKAGCPSAYSVREDEIICIA